jgi:predicted phosphodiesterase/predicted DNA-binding protein YlxM (UPF0122 family)
MINPKNRHQLKADALELKEKGYSVSETANELNISRSTVWDWYNDRKRNTDNYPIVYNNENLTFQKRNPRKENIDIQLFLEQLAPINMPKPKINQTSKDFSNYSVVMSDLHFPMQCEKSIDICFATIDELKPKSIIINGDSLDMLSISRFPKDIRTQFNLLDERKAYHTFLNQLIEVSDGAEIIEVHGNHSGDSTFGRWWRYLGERLGELACLPEIKQKLSYQEIFLGEYQSHVQMADYVELTPELVILHGEVVRKYGGYSARGNLEKYVTSVIVGHTHRSGHSPQRIPAIGSRGDRQIHAYELGCMCDLNPLYGSSPNWQNGFGIVAIGKDGGFGVELVNISNGSATISTLGKTITA